MALLSPRSSPPDRWWLSEYPLERRGKCSGRLISRLVRDRADGTRRREQEFGGHVQAPAREEAEDGLAHDVAEALGERAAREPHLAAQLLHGPRFRRASVHERE